ncbi:uncharacterized protein LOC115699710 [Cannabis sativa]|uniref:uncharacterized protein LOC115699710 n=1 Tax=Cannabis sativa TaxID=3483 RepID=UPI0029CA7503|nr:uncharacterized protein LOC115699710 [Cannabis sativa]
MLLFSKVCNPILTHLAILLPQQSSYLKTKAWFLPFIVGLDYLCRTLHLNISARTYVQLDDGTELLDAVMFGDVAENIFSCTAVQLRSYSDEKHKLFIQKTTKQLSAKKWRIQLYVDANRTMSSKYNQFTIQAVEPMED